MADLRTQMQKFCLASCLEALGKISVTTALQEEGTMASQPNDSDAGLYSCCICGALMPTLSKLMKDLQ